MKPVLCLTWLALALPAYGNDFDVEKANNWHQFRGPLATGEAPNADPPTAWSEEQNVKWKVEIPGKGNATPVIWNDRVYVLTAVPTGRIDPQLPKPVPRPPFGISQPNEFHQFMVICLDRSTGQRIWERVATEQVPHEGMHKDNSFASGSPTTDGKRLYVWFGSQGMYCYTLDGELAWQRDLGKVDTRLSFNEGSSPVLHGDSLILTRDQEGQSYILVLDPATGGEKWKKERDEPSCWATPIVVEKDGKTQVITNGKQRVRSYDLRNGDLLWECGGQVSNVTPSPVATQDLVVCMSGYRGNAALGIPLNQQGDLTDSDKIAWKLDRGTPYIPSPLLYRGLVYFTQSNRGILSVVEAHSGKYRVERRRLDGIQNLYGSPVAANGRVYITDRSGTTVVLKHGDGFEVLARNKLEDGFESSPAIAGKQLFLRGRKSLYCIETK